MTRRLCAVAVAAAALLVLPAAASADTAGSDFGREGESSPINCTDDSGQVPCTLAQDDLGWSIEVPENTIVTSWKAKLTAGTQARLHVLRRNGDGTYTSAGKSGAVTAAGGIQDFTTHIPVGSGSHTIAVDVLSGGIAAVEDTNTEMVAFDPPLGDGETRGGDSYGYELMLSARAEHDFDGDGLGDDTEDPCPFNTCPGGGGDDGSGDDGDDYTPPTGDGGGGSNPKGPAFTIDERSILRPGAAGNTGYIAVYVENTGETDLKGKLSVKVGRKSIGTTSVDLEWGDDYSYGAFKLSRADKRKLMRKGKLGAVATAKLRGEDGKQITVTKRLRVISGGATKFDGTYRGPGPVVFVVDRGVIVGITATMNTYCIKQKNFQHRQMMTAPGFPTLVKPDGSFSGKGSISTDTVKYYGKFKLRGTSKGYMSLFHTELRSNYEGKLDPDTCYDAKNWKIKKAR